MKRRISAALLSLCLLMSLMPSVAFAAPNGSFDDVDGHWGQAAVERWAGYGVVNGDGSGNFNPDNQMTRAEFATMLANMLGYKEKAANTFADVNEDDWFADAILKLAAAGVMQGSNGMANPNAPITRQEAAVLMCRAFNIPTTGGNLDFADSADVADWAKGAVAALADRGMMNGVGNNNVAPLADINRASVATLLDNMITEYVTEDKTITGEVSGIVLVAADATVTVEDATLNENLIVAPKADGAEVTLTGTTTASDVVVGAAATVKVDSNATAGEVQVGAANSTVEVAGKADAVTVDSAANNTAVNVTESAAVGDVALNAADTKVSVAENATVSNVAVSGSNANVEVSGKVDNVTVSSGATGTGITANSGATVGKVDTSANDVTVSGSGKVENVTANDGTVSVTTPNTSVENKTDSADNVTNNGTPVPPTTGGDTPTPTPPSGGGGGGGGSNVASADVVKANIHDNAGENPIADDKLGDVTVTGTVKTAATAESGPVYSVKITGRNIMNHTNADSTVGRWVGFGFPAADAGVSRTIKVGETTITNRTQETNGKTYNTVYFSEATEAAFKAATYTVVVADTKDGNTVTSKYEVTFDVTFYNPANDVTISKAIPENHADKNMSQYVLPAAQVAVSGLNVTLSGEVDPEQLNLGSYTYYFMKTSGNIAQLANGGDGFPASFAGGQAVATKIYESNSLRKITHTFTAKDAAGREQGTFTVTVDATGCTVKDMNTVKFNSNGGSAVDTKAVATNGKLDTLPTPTKTGYTLEGWYKEASFTNKWNTSNDSVTGNITLYAKWTPDEYTITYNLNSGTNAANNPAKYTIETDTITLADATRDGYIFAGWYDAATDGNKVTSIAKGSSGNKSLYARWNVQAKYKVGETETAISNLTISDGSSVTLTNEQKNTVKTAVETAYPSTTVTVPNTANNGVITVTVTTNVADKITAMTGTAVIDSKFGSVTPNQIQEITIGALTDGKYPVTGKLFKTTWTEFSSNTAEQEGYYSALALTIPAKYENSATVDYNEQGAKAYKDLPPFLTIMGNKDATDFNKKGVKLVIDLDGEGPIAAETYIYDFSAVKAVADRNATPQS